LGLRTSADTVLRELRRAAPEKKRPSPRVVGIDDWAIKRGHHYGTIVVDLERRKPIAVFEGRETMTVAAWLGDNPSITVVARDRAGAYSEAVETALPAARQISDRWHLLCNLRDNIERMLHRLGPQMRQAAQQVVMAGVTLGRQGRPRGASLAGWQRLSDDRRNARLALYEQVMSLRTQGCTMKAIGRELSIDHRTVSKFVRAGCFPERAARARCVTPLDAHRSYIEDRVAQGCRCPRQIWQEVRDRGYTGSRAVVQHCVTRLLYPQGKTALVEAPVRTMPCPSARRAFGWMVGVAQTRGQRGQERHPRTLHAGAVRDRTRGGGGSKPRAPVPGAHAPQEPARVRSLAGALVQLRGSGNAELRRRPARRPSGRPSGLLIAMEQRAD
jgi:hypothetical protein